MTLSTVVTSLVTGRAPEGFSVVAIPKGTPSVPGYGNEALAAEHSRPGGERVDLTHRPVGRLVFETPWGRHL